MSDVIVVPLLTTVAVVVIAFVLRVVLGRVTRPDPASIEAWTDPSVRSKPDAVDLGALDLSAPQEGRLLGVVFTHPACDACDPVAHRISGIDGVDAAIVDVSTAPDAVRAAGVTSVPTLVLVGTDGGVVRSWVGAPLAGTVEDTVRRHLG